MLDTLEFIELRDIENLPNVPFFDWDDEDKDILVKAWVDNMGLHSRQELYRAANIQWEFPVPYDALDEDDKGDVYMKLEDRLCDLVKKAGYDDSDIDTEHSYVQF